MAVFFEFLAVVGLLALSAFFSASEVAFLSVTRIQLQRLLDQKRPGAEALARLKTHPQRVIIAILIGNNVVNVGASVLAASVALELFGDAGLGLAAGVITFLILVFGEITPKALASTQAQAMALTFAPVLEVLQTVLTPLIFFFELIIQIVPGSYSRGGVVVTEEEIKAAARLGVKDKAVSENERALIENVFLFSDKPVSHCMTPKNKTHVFTPDLHVDVALHKALQSPHSRFPVISGVNPVGVITLKRLSHAVLHHSRDPVSKHMRPPVLIAQDKTASEAFSFMQAKGVNMAVVTGVRGGYVGVVTLKDLLEELVGEIQ
ncbi:DUF21 domain-containing protein [Candidatus Micrarchaeota archaeon]|nr:DUF21 domain-containing protein [Candidatus Micrarchaeota archaeon]